MAIREGKHGPLAPKLFIESTRDKPTFGDAGGGKYIFCGSGGGGGGTFMLTFRLEFGTFNGGGYVGCGSGYRYALGGVECADAVFSAKCGGGRRGESAGPKEFGWKRTPEDERSSRRSGVTFDERGDGPSVAYFRIELDRLGERLLST